MKSKIKKIAYKILKILWFSIGGLIIFWTIFWYVKSHTINSLGVLATVILFATGIYMLMIFGAITLLFLFIKWIIKKCKKKK